MNRAIDAYLGELAARRFSHSRRDHSARTLERLLIYMREAHSITDWRAVNESQLRDFALHAATRHRSSRGKRISAATLRHTCATHLLKGRADIRQIQKLLGHRRLSSTEVYTRVELTDLHEVIARCHPREKQK